ncbi:MAG: DEAD/DEAH box helicase [Bacteroidota bacterium]|nr:DEAD/DEAH box helicase [Bacteroidota bacterium]
MSFSTLGLSDQLMQAIHASGYTTPTEIQSRAIPIALEGKDLIGRAQTGTGKTAAFVLPMLHYLSSTPRTNRTRALILTPTRELARQVEDSITAFGRFLQLTSLSVYGGVNMNNQIKRLGRGVDIIIATPGRLLDHVKRKTADLSGIEILVLDEADRMLDMGFIHDVRTIISRVPIKRQTMLFSATISEEIKKLAATIQKSPEVVEVGERRAPAEGITQHFYSIPQNKKLNLLFHLLEAKSLDSVLVFSRTKHGADAIARKLAHKGISATAIHSNRSQAQRQRALDGFKQRHHKVLVATDIAARGIDVERISHVINFDVPAFAEDYVHRIGRTGRAEATGDAITFVSPAEQMNVKKIERFISKRFVVERFPGFDYSQETVENFHRGERHEAFSHANRPQKQKENEQNSKYDKVKKKSINRVNKTGHSSEHRDFPNAHNRKNQFRENPAKRINRGRVTTEAQGSDWGALADDAKDFEKGFLKKLFTRDR